MHHNMGFFAFWHKKKSEEDFQISDLAIDDYQALGANHREETGTNSLVQQQLRAIFGRTDTFRVD